MRYNKGPKNGVPMALNIKGLAPLRPVDYVPDPYTIESRGEHAMEIKDNKKDPSRLKLKNKKEEEEKKEKVGEAEIKKQDMVERLYILA